MLASRILLGGNRRRVTSVFDSYHPSQEAGYLAWFDDETLARNNTAGNVISSWQSHEGTYTATQAVNANRPVAQIDANGVMHAVSDGVDDFLTLNTPAIGTQGFWVFWLGRVSSLSAGFDATLLLLGTLSSAGSGVNFTAESKGRFNNSRLASADISVPLGSTLHTASIRNPVSGTVGDTIISIDNTDRAMTYGNSTSPLNFPAGGSLTGISGAGSLNGATYAVGIYTGIPDAAARTRVRDYAVTRAQL